MLEGIETVDWSTVQDAHGVATEVPALLQAAASEDAAERTAAYHELWDRVCHDGDVSETAAFHCVPFLAELALGPPEGGRPEALRLLTGIAGVSFAAVDIEREERLRPWWEARRAVRRQLFRLIRGLDSTDPPLALATAALLACFPFEMTQMRPRLRAMRGAGSDEYTRDVLTFALFLLGDRDLATMRAVQALEERSAVTASLSLRLHLLGVASKRNLNHLLAGRCRQAAAAFDPATREPEQGELVDLALESMERLEIAAQTAVRDSDVANPEEPAAPAQDDDQPVAGDDDRVDRAEPIMALGDAVNPIEPAPGPEETRDGLADSAGEPATDAEPTTET